MARLLGLKKKLLAKIYFAHPDIFMRSRLGFIAKKDIVIKYGN